MPSIRELFANLGFKVDTTPATRFDAAVNRSRKNLKGLNTISLSGLVNTATKAFAIVTGVATAGSLAAAKKFAELERSWDALKFAAEESFVPLKKEIEKILKDKVLKNLIDEAEILDGTLTEIQEKGFKGDQFIKFLRLAALLAIQTKKPFKEVLGLITGFVVEGDLGIFKLLRELPPALQEAFKAAGIDPAQVGFIGRGEKISESLRKVEAELERNILKQRERGLTTFKELENAFKKLNIAIGKETLPWFKKFNDKLISAIGILTLFTGVKVGPKGEEKNLGRIVFEALFPRLSKVLTEKKIPDREEEEDLQSAVDIFQKKKRRRRQEKFRRRRQENIPSITDTDRIVIPFAPETTNNRGGDTNVIVNVKVESGGTGDPIKIKQAVNEGIRETMGTVKELSNVNTPRWGGD